MMLQQTQVKTVIGYFERFIERFPDPGSLAGANEEEVIELWAGLGYYSRCRNLHRASKQIARDFAGEFPSDPEQIAALPGIGPYSLAAIASIAFGTPLAVIDGNVERVLARYLTIPGDPRKGAARQQIAEAATSALDRTSPGDHNQAMMELGALVCTPRSPRCNDCPLADGCKAYQSGDPQRWPEPRQRRRTEIQQWVAAVPRYRRSHLLIKRPANAPFLPGQWGTPMTLVDGIAPPDRELAVSITGRLLLEEAGLTAVEAQVLPQVRHSITYRRLRVTPVILEISGPPPDGTRLVGAGEGSKLAALFRKVLDAADLLPVSAARGQHSQGESR